MDLEKRSVRLCSPDFTIRLIIQEIWKQQRSEEPSARRTAVEA
jgi:hypothetical protein